MIYLFINSCGIKYKNVIQGTWYFINQDYEWENGYSEFAFYKNRAYSTYSGLGPQSSEYSINRDSITFFEDSVRLGTYKYISYKDSILLFFDNTPIVLKRSVINIKETEFNVSNKKELKTFFENQIIRASENFQEYYKPSSP